MWEMKVTNLENGKEIIQRSNNGKMYFEIADILRQFSIAKYKLTIKHLGRRENE